MAQELNCVGLACPQPVMRCRDLIAKEKPGTFDVIVDNEAAVENVTRFLSRSGYAVSRASRDGGQFVLHATRTEDVPVSEEIPSCDLPVSRVGKTVVLVPTDCIGRGDEELGRAVMANYLATYLEVADRIWSVILMNYGAKMACEEGKNLESLKKLEAEGIRILVCGTCLAHFGLMDKLLVGEVSNLLDIVTMMSEADKVISI